MPFFWYELMTSDLDAAEAFYTRVVGWTAQPFDKAPGMPRYIVMNVGERGVGGLMTMPEDASKMGIPPAWLGYVKTKDVDVSTKALKAAGGAVHREPGDIPGVGRFAVVADPQGATFMFLQPNGPDQPVVPAGTPGHIGWHELYTSDWKAAFDFYSGQFGWETITDMDMGAMGKYRIFGLDGVQMGGMMNKPENVPVSSWVYYVNVEGGLDDAVERVKANGGQGGMGPMEVPGGSWVLQGVDPQGAAFALIATRR